ncbi:MAG: S8 family serine peptidase [Phycisphaerales bacterium]|nr:S8 family serine peptidase [Phycisphaerales bacterium]
MLGQVGGGYQGIEPILLLNDPYFTPSAYSPHGQHWLHTTKVTYAWRLLGYDQPYSVDHNNPNRTIAFIDSGIDMNHPEFGVDGMLPWKLHPASATFVQEGFPVLAGCDCDPSIYEAPDPEGGPTDVQDRLWAIVAGILPHGTIVAGIAGAYAQNAQGIAGVCWDCSLLVLRVATFHGSSGLDCLNSCRPTTVSVAASIRYAAGWSPGQSEDDDSEWSPVRARVICTATEGIANYNQSSFCDENDVLNRAIDMAHARGCIIVAIVGNDTGVCWEALADPDDPACTPLAGTTGTPSSNPLAWQPKTITVGGPAERGRRGIVIHAPTRLHRCWEAARTFTIRSIPSTARFPY